MSGLPVKPQHRMGWVKIQTESGNEYKLSRGLDQ
jgi:hypothetical protein